MRTESVPDRLKRTALLALGNTIGRPLPTGAAYPPATDWVAELRTLRWLNDDLFEIRGWAYDRAVDYTGTQPVIRAWLQSTDRLPFSVDLDVTPEPSPEANQPFNGASKDSDYSRNCFRATGSVSALLAAFGQPKTWRLRIAVAVPGSEVQGPFAKFYALSTPNFRTARRSGGFTVTPRWSKAAGLFMEVAPLAPTASAIQFHQDSRELSVTVAHSGALTGAALVSAQGRTELSVSAGDEGTSVLSGVLPEIEPDREWREPQPSAWGADPDAAGEGALAWLQHRLVVKAAGAEVPVLLGSSALAVEHPLLVESGPGGELRFNSGSYVLIEDARLVGDDVPALELSGRCRGDLAGSRLVLANERDRREGELRQDGERFHAVIPFLVSKWDLPALPPQIGRLLLAVETQDGRSVVARCSDAVLDLAATSVWNKWFRLYYSVRPGKVLAPRLEIPMTDDEIGTFNQARIQRQYESGVWPIVDKMYFESFYGRQCGCNPLALREELAATHPQVPRVWAVRDLSVAVPEGDQAVVDGTTAWWRARAECRWLIVNDWLRARFTPREGQTVLQTWHGTMYKKVGLDRGEQLDAEERDFMLGERKKWDLLLSQNPHSTRVFRESYLSNPPIYEEGYPRNDLLVNGSGESIRRALGIRDDQAVVLYAPTWRDDRTELVDYLDVNQLAADLGPRYVVLLRAHSRVIRVGSAAKVGDGVIDVSTYPNTTDLLLIADLMITDYSSIMFDYAVTGRPMIFFTPDLDEYRDQLRGVYLDLAEVGPGPMLFTQDDVLAAIRDIDQVAATFAERYAKWQSDYVPWDDGGCSERVLERLFKDAPPAEASILR